jgi:uncharacterized DUF497 family protein
MALIFEWDEKKAEQNLKKHPGISFNEAKTVFNDEFSITIDVGISAKGRVLVVVYTERFGIIRIISARKATSTEEKNMKNPKDHIDESDMRAEYDFSHGVQGKHSKAYRQGHTVKIHKEDDTTIVQEFTLDENAVVIEPDVREYFPDAESVNHALRSLIALIPQQQKTLKPRRREKYRPSATENQPG